MCQAYEAEAAFMRSMDEFAAQAGFEDRLSGKPNSASGRSCLSRDAYQHGWDCVGAGVLPWGVEKALGLDVHGVKFTCPACGEIVARYSRRKDGASHDFGYPCDGSNPFEYQRKEARRKQYLALKQEFDPES